MLIAPWNKQYKRIKKKPSWIGVGSGEAQQERLDGLEEDVRGNWGLRGKVENLEKEKDVQLCGSLKWIATVSDI